MNLNNEKICSTTATTTSIITSPLSQLVPLTNDKTDIEVNSPERDNNMYYLGNYMKHQLKRISQQRLLSSLSPEECNRVRALLKLQFETMNLDAEFHRMVYDLEKEFQNKFENIFNKRAEIINGTYSPTETECDYPDNDFDVFKQFRQFESQKIELATDLNNNNQENKLNLIGLSNFWLNIFKYTHNFDNMVKKLDEPLLKHLIDIAVTIKPLSELAFILEFKFSPNEYFENLILTKEYLLRCEPDSETPFEFDGPEIYKSIGCEIKWKDGKNLTQKMIKHKGSVGDQDGKIEFIKVESFFNFFYPPLLPEDENHPDYDNINKQLLRDFEIGHYLKERVIPRAVLYYIGEYDSFYDVDDDNDDDTDDDDNTDDGDTDDDDSDNEIGDDDGQDDQFECNYDTSIESITTTRPEKEINYETGDGGQ